jgi:polyisoprenoid-binding protein YceI
MGSWLIRASVVVVVIVAAAGASWWFFIREDAKLATSPLDFRETPAAGVSPAAGATAAPTSTAAYDATHAAGAPAVTVSQGYTLYTVVAEDSAVAGQTEAAYFADETLARVGLPSTAKGATAGVSGYFAIGPDGLDPAVESRIVVALANLRSDESRRDSRMRDALQVTQFPEATFTATSIEGWTGDVPEGQDVSLALTGMMDLHGVQKELTWDLVARRQGDVITALATVNFLYEDFDIPVLNIAGIVSVEEDVTLQVQLIAKAQE